MDTGDLLTRGSIWLALAAYAAGAMHMAWRRGEGRPLRSRRAWWTAAWAAYVVHVVAAFHFHHGWSHAEAVHATAERTEAVTGWGWGGGIWVNYAFTLLWSAEIVWWWTTGDSFFHRRRSLRAAWQGLFLFIVINASVVFVSGSARLAGAAVCLLVLAAWAASATSKPARPT